MKIPIAVFQRTFLVSVHSLGRFFSLATPWLSGPRHCAQLEPEFPGFVFATVNELERNVKANVEQNSMVRILFTNGVSLF